MIEWKYTLKGTWKSVARVRPTLNDHEKQLLAVSEQTLVDYWNDRWPATRYRVSEES